jgi:hypothetical protein
MDKDRIEGTWKQVKNALGLNAKMPGTPLTPHYSDRTVFSGNGIVKIFHPVVVE